VAWPQPPILHGTNPADLLAQAPTKFEMAVNLNTAKTLGRSPRHFSARCQPEASFMLFIGHTYVDVTFLKDHIPIGDEKRVASEYAISFGNAGLAPVRQIH
jgi:hypothetical protein